jgi:hypothetical protein
VTSVLCTSAVWRELRRGTLPPLRHGILSRWPHLAGARLRRGITLAAACVVLLFPFTSLALWSTGSGGISPTAYVVYSTIFGVALGLLVTPLVAIRALTDDLSATRG